MFPPVVRGACGLYRGRPGANGLDTDRASATPPTERGAAHSTDPWGTAGRAMRRGDFPHGYRARGGVGAAVACGRGPATEVAARGCGHETRRRGLGRRG